MNLTKFYLARNKERDIIKKGIDHLSPHSEVWEYLVKIDYNIYIYLDKIKQVYLVPHKFSKVLKNIRDSNPELKVVKGDKKLSQGAYKKGGKSKSGQNGNYEGGKYQKHPKNQKFLKYPKYKESNEMFEVVHAGIYFGFIDSGEFHLSLEAAEFIFYELNAPRSKEGKVNNGPEGLLLSNSVESRQDIKSKSANPLNLRIIRLDENSSKSFLYGNDIDMNSIVDMPRNLHRKDLVFVLDDKGNFIGLGMIYIKTIILEDRNPKFDNSNSSRLGKHQNKGKSYRERGRGNFNKNKGKSIKRNFQKIEEIKVKNLVDYGYYIRRGA